MSVIADLRAECDALHDFVAALTPAQWRLPTIFHGWTAYDQSSTTITSISSRCCRSNGRMPFAGIVAEVARRTAADPAYPFRHYTNEVLGALTPAAALAAWRTTYHSLCALLASRDPAERMNWFGPPMSLEGCAAARQMEVWAHGQDIYDLFRIRRPNTDRLRNIAMLGVKTFGWSFVNRGLPPPPIKPYLALTAPSGQIWHWNDPASPERIEGPAEDFCLVVTQRRHADDTPLRVIGQGGQHWLSIAQCFAGDPADGPPPGHRVVDHAPTPALTAQGAA